MQVKSVADYTITDPKEKKAYNKIKRNLMKTFVNPNHSVKMLIDLAAAEYMRYYIGKDITPAQKTHLVASVRETLGELDLTPRSKKAGEVSSTLSLIFKSIGEHRGKRNEEKVDEGTES